MKKRRKEKSVRTKINLLKDQELINLFNQHKKENPQSKFFRAIWNELFRRELNLQTITSEKYPQLKIDRSNLLKAML